MTTPPWAYNKPHASVITPLGDCGASGSMTGVVSVRMFGVVIDRIHKGLRAAMSTEELLASKPTAEYDARWGDPTLFVTLAFQGTWRHLRDAYDTRLPNIA